MASDDVEENLESYKAQLRQVDAALLIDESNEDLKKLKSDLLEVIALTEELLQINEEVAEPVAPVVPVEEEKPKDWKSGDRVQAPRTIDGELLTATVDIIADDNLNCTVKFDNSDSVDVVKISALKPLEPEKSENPKFKKLTRDEVDKRREQKKKKLLKKKQRMKEFEEAREAGKVRWQQFYKKGTLKGKHRIKGLNKKSIFASREDGKGKIGVGTCGTSGKGMTQYTPASAYMYKK